MEIITHQKIDRNLCGTPIELKQGFARVELKTTEVMAADDKGLVHGGFIFGLADYAAMIAVNHPLVVLGGAQVKFLKPVRVGESVTATAEITKIEGKKNVAAVSVEKADRTTVFSGELTCFVLDNHVLDH